MGDGRLVSLEGRPNITNGGITSFEEAQAAAARSRPRPAPLRPAGRAVRLFRRAARKENGVAVLYAWFDGKRIARRRAGERWVMLEPGYTVRGGEPGCKPGDVVEVEFDPTTAKLQ